MINNKQLSVEEVSAICSGLASGCEKQLLIPGIKSLLDLYAKEGDFTLEIQILPSQICS